MPSPSLPKAIAAAAAEADAQIEAFSQGELVNTNAVDPVTGEPVVTAPPPAPPHDDWEQRYKSMKGRYDAELPTLRAQINTYENINRTLSGQVADLTERVAKLSAQRIEAPQADSVTQKDVEQYGQDLIDLVSRITRANTDSARAAILDELRGMTRPVQQSVEAVQRSQAETALELYRQRLTEAIPDWQEINVDPVWLAWLQEFDPLMGSTRQASLSAAYAKLDAPRTLAFLRAFLQVHPRAAQPAVTPQDELIRQTAPRTVPSASVSTEVTPSGKKIWTQDEIGDAYTAKLQGKFKHNPDQWERIKAEIDSAAAEGRVR